MNHDDLDRRIRAALDVELSPRQLARLEDFWQSQSRAQRRRHFVAGAVVCAAALATMLVVGATVSLWLCGPKPGQGPVAPHDVARVDPPAISPTGKAPSEDVAVVQSPAKDELLSAGRPPTAYERVFFMARSRRLNTARRPSTPIAASRQASDSATVEIEKLVTQ
ncbi:MAG: hypothetical protein JW888_01900, partial [Pirellulales bacterium]|nr:hypothetical protein [Pirellulales bacterium]